MTSENTRSQNPDSSGSFEERESHKTPGSQNLALDQKFDPAKLLLLLNASKALASTTNLDELLSVIVSEVQHVIDCEGAGVLLYDEDRDDFYWRTVQDKQSFLASAREEIRIPRDRGVCAWVFDRGEPALINDAANDPRIYREVENKSGFHTRNMVCTPLQTSDKSLGALYALNKTHGLFTDDDVEILSALSSNVALALENASYVERLANSNIELQRLNRAKDKMLHHLSHELKTPLAIIDASLGITRKKLERHDIDPNQFPLQRISRNLDRLKTIEKQVVHIVEGKGYKEKGVIVSFLDYLEDFLEIEETERPEFAGALNAIKQRILSLFPSKEADTEFTNLHDLLDEEKFHVNRMKQDRDVDIRFDISEPIVIRVPSQILKSVVRGLLRNAVENTPDSGRIDVRADMSADGCRITVKDYGVGIPLDDQPNLFEGFYPIQETDLYSSGRPYGFNAGGSGTDLLKIKIFSERLGFDISFKSSRCTCIPTSRDICPGIIAKCSCCENVSDCLENGGTEFTVHFPADMLQKQNS